MSIKTNISLQDIKFRLEVSEEITISEFLKKLQDKIFSEIQKKKNIKVYHDIIHQLKFIHNGRNLFEYTYNGEDVNLLRNDNLMEKILLKTLLEKKNNRPINEIEVYNIRVAFRFWPSFKNDTLDKNNTKARILKNIQFISKYKSEITKKDSFNIISLYNYIFSDGLGNIRRVEQIFVPDNFSFIENINDKTYNIFLHDIAYKLNNQKYIYVSYLKNYNYNLFKEEVISDNITKLTFFSRDKNIIINYYFINEIVQEYFNSEENKEITSIFEENFPPAEFRFIFWSWYNTKLFKDSKLRQKYIKYKKKYINLKKLIY